MPDKTELICRCVVVCTLIMTVGSFLCIALLSHGKYTFSFEMDKEQEKRFRERFPLIAKLADRLEEKDMKIIWDEGYNERQENKKIKKGGVLMEFDIWYGERITRIDTISANNLDEVIKKAQNKINVVRSQS